MRRYSDYRSLKDCHISPSDIPQKYSALSLERAMTIRDEVSNGEYISIRNQNNLAEVLIYRRSDFLDDDPKVMRWDGTSVNYDWYNSPDKDIYEIANAEQLAGLGVLVSKGNNFSGKTIRLSANINLNSKEWSPIGSGDVATKVDISGDTYYKVECDELRTFSGTFDGDGYTIYGLRMTNIDPENVVSGFFKSLNHAIVKNVIFENVMINSKSKNTCVSAVCGYAKETTFINVIISGKIQGVSCSSVASIAVDTSFYDCINRASLTSKTDTEHDDVVVGGIVGQISLSDDTISKIHQKGPILFERCIQAGFITVYSSKAEHIWSGHMYGCLAFDPKGEPHGIVIDRCSISSDIIVYDLNTDETKVSFFGKETLNSFPKNYTGIIGEKVDLLNGLLGKTSTAIDVLVNKITTSTVISNIVLPGSLNMLHSESFTNSFVTVDTCQISSEDGITNLKPYFVFIKTGKI